MAAALQRARSQDINEAATGLAGEVTEAELRSMVEQFPGRMAKELARLLSEDRNRQVEATVITAALEQMRNVRSSMGPRGAHVWYVDGPPARTASVSAGAKSPDLYPWQQEALKVWRQRGYQGVIEAVTGAGKTRLALKVASDAIAAGMKVAVIVPSKELMHQWVRLCHLEIRHDGPLSIGRLGDGHSDDLHRCNFLVAIAASASRYILLPEGETGLLIGDEVHRLGAQHWSRALEDEFDRRLGLTATYERPDSGVEDFLDPYFTGVVFSVGYDRALREGAISPFKIALVGVALSSAEREAYEEKDRYARKWRAWLISNTTVPAEPFGDFIREVSKLSKSGMREAGLYLSAFSQRRAILADSSAKHEALTSLFPAIGACERAIIFTQTKHSAERAVLALQSHGIESGLLTSDLTQNERRNALAEFEEGESKAIAAPILLDEGVDVPEADLAVIIASSRSRRQMIQRMGRVIRPKTDGRMARVVVLFVEGTFEDPRGSQEAFLDLVMPAAEDVRTFERGFAEDDLLAYLNDWSPG